ncbi:MFS transporter, partial [Actinotalea ferrariae]|uniref:MFS transporter n=1 Tax=Actinotalea ferrariae TaxID=1386098 RepID=UPI001C8BEC24
MTSGAAPSTDASTPSGRTAGLRRLVPSLSAVGLALAATYAAVLVVLLPGQVAAVDPDAKVANLAVVTTTSFALTLLAQPLIGTLSDRTGGRFGRRSPWMLGCGAVAAALLVALGAAQTLPALVVLWAFAQFSLNGVDVAAAAAVPDQVPPERRGTVFAVLGFAAVLGGAVGVVTAGGRGDRPDDVYTVLAVAVLAAVLAYVALDRDRPHFRPGGPPTLAGRSAPRERWTTAARRAADAVRREPAFTRGFVARLLFVLAYQLVYTFQLYVLVDHVGVPEERADAVLVLLTVGTLVAILVGAVVCGWWSDRIGDRRVFLAAASGLLAVALLVPLLVPTVAGMAVFAGLKGLAFGAFTACGTALATEAMPQGSATAGRDLGVYNVATNVPQTLAPALAAALVGTAGYPALFVTAVAVACAAVWVSVRIPAPTRGTGGSPVP